MCMNREPFRVYAGKFGLSDQLLTIPADRVAGAVAWQIGPSSAWGKLRLTPRGGRMADVPFFLDSRSPLIAALGDSDVLVEPVPYGQAGGDEFTVRGVAGVPASNSSPLEIIIHYDPRAIPGIPKQRPPIEALATRAYTVEAADAVIDLIPCDGRKILSIYLESSSDGVSWRLELQRRGMQFQVEPADVSPPSYNLLATGEKDTLYLQNFDAQLAILYAKRTVGAAILEWHWQVED